MPLKHVIVRVEGGLGNQLFQYAAARSLADRLKCELLVDLRGLLENGDRPYQLNLYRTRSCIASDECLNSLPSPRLSRLGRIRSKVFRSMPALYPYPIFWPNSFSYDEYFEKIKHPSYIVGYWQSEKYFSWNRAQILDDLNLVEGLPPNHEILTQIRSTNSVALHVRRGDYVSNIAAANYHGTCNLKYYIDAFYQLNQHEKNIELFVFSDDINWAKSNLLFDVPTHFMSSNSTKQGYLDLELMRNCRHHIIANSSFSWWGAWLCERVGQRVYAPQKWFLDSKVDTSDIIPNRWHTVDINE